MAIVNVVRYVELSPWVILTLIVGLVFTCWQFLLPKSLDPREPPEVKATIPVFGHLLGMLWHKAEYATILSRKVKLPIYTIRIFGSRIYVICSPELILKTFANPKTFTFDAFVSDALGRLLNKSESEVKAFFQPGVDGSPSYSSAIHDLMQATLAPGPALTQMNANFHSRLAGHLNEISTEGTTVKLHQWSRDVVTRAACAAIFGSDNPYEDDPSLVESLWDFEADITLLIVRIFPSLTAHKGFIGRARVQQAYRRYFDAGLWKNGSALLQGRMAIAKKHGFTDPQIADWEVLMTIAAVTNAIPISFWMLSYIVADPELTTFVLNELKAVVSITVVDGIKTAKIDPALIRSRCPLLISIWEELLRFTSQPVLGRAVTSDIVLNNEYLLTAGAVVQIPTGIPQSDSSLWGPDAAILNPNRFLKGDEKLQREKREQRKLQNRAYTPFGGGKNLCPGRHIAANETLSFVSMMIYGFSVENKDHTPFTVIQAAQKAFGASVPKARKDVEVVIKRREELKGVKLAFAVGDDVLRDIQKPAGI